MMLLALGRDGTPFALVSSKQAAYVIAAHSTLPFSARRPDNTNSCRKPITSLRRPTTPPPPPLANPQQHHHGLWQRSQIRHLLHQLGHIRPRPPSLLPPPRLAPANTHPLRIRQRTPGDGRSLPDRPVV